MSEPKKAEFAVHWPGQTSLNCKEHAEKLQALGAHMGFKVDVTPAVTPAPCANCENEQKAGGSPII